MTIASVLFEERRAEVETYLDFLSVMEERAGSGPPKFDGASEVVSVEQQKILYSGVYLQLYNLVESSVTTCISMVSAAAQDGGRWKPSDLAIDIRREWVRAIACTHVELSPDNRLKTALDFCDHLVESLPIRDFSIEKGGGGNWDDDAIEKITNRLGFRLQISQPIYSDIKRKFRDDMGPLTLVKSFRNRLAHGSISFVECSEGVSVTQLRDLADKVIKYLREVINCFSTFVERFEFLLPDRRP